MAIWKEGEFMSWYAELGDGLNLSVFHNPSKLDPDRPYEVQVFRYHTIRAATREEAQQAAERIARKALSQALAALDAKDDEKDGETMSNETTQYTPADVRDRIIRASILPFEDEETMIAGLRAGAEAVERGELDAEDFAGIWSQYLRELFRRASSVPTPADVRERVTGAWATVEAAALAQAARVEEYEWNNDEAAEIRDAVAQVAALLRTPRGEGEAEALAWRIEYRGKTSNGWHYQSTCDSLKEAEEKVMRLRRGGVPLEYRIVPLYPAARRGEGGGE